MPAFLFHVRRDRGASDLHMLMCEGLAEARRRGQAILARLDHRQSVEIWCGEKPVATLTRPGRSRSGNQPPRSPEG
jgi:hypothetical protein